MLTNEELIQIDTALYRMMRDLLAELRKPVDEPEFILVSEAAARYNVCNRTIKKRLDALGIPCARQAKGNAFQRKHLPKLQYA